MSRYVVWVTEEVTKKVWFDADDREHANSLIEQIQEGELDTDDLPSVSSSIKASETLFLDVEEVLYG
jgi:hypothetical protein